MINNYRSNVFLKLLTLMNSSLSLTEKLFCVTVFSMVIISSLSTSYYPIQLHDSVDYIETGHNRNAFLAIFLAASIYIFSGLLNNLIWIFIGKFEQPIFNVLRRNYIFSVLDGGASAAGGRSTGELSEILGIGVQGLRTIIFTIILNIFPSLLHFVFILIFSLFYLGYSIYFILLFGITFHFSITWWSSKLISRKQGELQHAFVSTQKLATDLIINRSMIINNNSQKFSMSLYEEVLDYIYSKSKKFLFSRGLFGCISAIILGVTFGISLFVAMYNVTQSSYSIAQFVLTISYSIQLINLSGNLSFSYREFRNAMVGLEKSLSIVNAERVEERGGHLLAPDPASIEFRNVCFAYPGKEATISGLNLFIGAGKIFGIMGESGKGKSTLAKMLIAEMEPSGGRVEINKIPVEKYNPRSLRARISIVPQNITLLNRSIADNLRVTRSDATDQEVIVACRKVGLGKFIDKLPNGINAHVGELGMSISGGEKQRIAIAQALLKRSSIVIFDEATSALDYENEKNILNLLESEFSDCTRVVISHKKSSMSICDDVYSL